MKFANVEFPTEGDAAKALYGLMQRGRITVLRDHSFIVPAPALDWLNEHQIPYTVVRMLNHDDVVTTLRSDLTHSVQ